MRDSFIYVAIYLNKNSPLKINLCVFVFLPTFSWVSSCLYRISHYY